MKTIIIGGGVLGASSGFHLARAGAAVTIIDACLDGRATAAGAGIICPWVSSLEDEPFYRLYAGGAEYYPELMAALGELGETDSGYRRAGAMLVSADQAELNWLERLAHRRQAPAMGAVTRLDPAAARAAFPPLRHDFGGIHIAGGARVDGRRLAAALLRAAERLGAEVRRGTAALQVKAGRVQGVALDGADLPADCVVVAAGAWGDAVLRAAGGRLPIEPQRGQIVHLRLPNAESSAWPVILPPGDHYLVPFEEGRIVAGATRESGVGFDYRVTAAGQHEVLTEALTVAPGLAAATLLETRVGFRPVGAVRPMLGRVPGIEGLVVGNGLGAAGLTIGPLAGRMLADLALGRATLMDLAPFSLERLETRAEPAALR